MTQETERQTEREKRPVVPNRETIGSLFADTLQKKITRREALGTSGKVAIGAAVAVLAAGGAAAYFATRPSSVVTSTVTGTTTLSPSTVTSVSTTTATSTATSTATLTSTLSGIAGGPGIDYYYDPSLKGTTINYLASSLPEKPPVWEFIPVFESETGITVNVTTLGEADLETKAATVLAAGSSQYDIVDAGDLGAIAYDYWKSGYLTPISKFIPLCPPGWNAQDFLPNVVEACSTFPEDTGGTAELISLPIVAATCMGIWYDMAAFGKAGAPVPFPGTCQLGSYVKGTPITFQEFLGYAAKVHNPPSKIGFGPWSAAPVYDAFGWEPFVWSMNKNYITKDFRPNFTDPDVITATEQYASVIKQFITDPVTWDWGAENSAATAGRLASWTTCNTDYPDIFASGSSITPDNVRFAWSPSNVTSPLMIAGSTPAISAFSKNQNAAWSFYSWMKSPRMEQLFFLAGNAPTRKSILTSPTNNALQLWPAQDILQSTAWLNDAKIIGTSGAPQVYCNIDPKMPRFLDLCTQIGTELNYVFAGTETAATAMGNLQTFATNLFKEIGFYGKVTYNFGT